MFLETLNTLMVERGLNKGSLSKQSGVPYTTIDGFYKKGYANAKLSTLRQLAAFFDVSLDYLVGDNSKKENAFEVTTEEKMILKKYRVLNKEGRLKVLEYMVDLAHISEYTNFARDSDIRLIANKKQSGDTIIRDEPRIT